MKLETKLEIGQSYTDSVSGFKGICTGVTIYLNGCIQGLIEAKPNNNNDKPVSQWIDEQRLVGKAFAFAGGPQNAPSGPGH
jgi:hypothetical protein